VLIFFQRGKPNSERQVEAIMNFGGTHFKVEAIYKPTGQKTNAEFRFALSKKNYFQKLTLR
jgi:hypothetical protein